MRATTRLAGNELALIPAVAVVSAFWIVAHARVAHAAGQTGLVVETALFAYAAVAGGHREAADRRAVFVGGASAATHVTGAGLAFVAVALVSAMYGVLDGYKDVNV